MKQMKTKTKTKSLSKEMEDIKKKQTNIWVEKYEWIEKLNRWA